MEAITTPTTLWKILGNSKIVVPTFQRDYAQGRAGKEDLRKKFLSEIKEALLPSSKELLLDFVYGTKNNNIIYPLDGQQRLTTLWVLMWYATFKTWNKLDAEVKNKRKEHLKNFTYETRPSSKNFIEWLCSDDFLQNSSSKFEASKELLSDFIQNQNGFYSGWKQDPTVQSILRMISGTKIKIGDGIEQIFNDENLDRLFEDACPIKFYHLNLLGIKQPDNLYVKMNARGEQLTGFENFKADLVGCLLKKEDLKHFVTLGSDEYVLRKWDVDWTDLFWGNRGTKDSVDDLFFTFIKRFLFNRYIAEGANADKDDVISKILYDNEQKEYTSFEIYESLIDKDCIKDLVAVFDNAKELKLDVPLLNAKEYTFLPQHDDKGNVKSATFQERVMMYGVCLFLQRMKVSDGFNHWLRVLGNLSYYNEISSFKEYESRLKFVKHIVSKLDDELANVYSNEALKKLNAIDVSTENHTQLNEEIKKIKKINAEEEVEKTLKGLESLWIFSGHIDSLLDDDLLKKQGLVKMLQELIGEKSNYLYDNEKLTSLFQAILTKTELKTGLKFNDEHDNFRKILNGELKKGFQAIIKNVITDSDVIENVIKEYEYQENDWKYALIKDKSLWKYSYGKFGKHFSDDDEYYLFKGTNRNDADIPLKAYSKFVYEQFEQKEKFPTSIEYQREKDNWNVYYDEVCVTFPKP